MATEISDRATAVEEFAVGAAESAAQVARHPVRAAQKQARTFERKGAPVVRRINRRINRQLNEMMPQGVKIFGVKVDGRLPENLAVKGLHVMRAQAHRPDVVGDVAKRTLKMFHGSFKNIVRTATRLEEASMLTTPAERKPAATRRPGRRTARRRAA